MSARGEQHGPHHQQQRNPDEHDLRPDHVVGELLQLAAHFEHVQR